MRVVTVPCLSDNYAYLVADEGRREAVVVDPSEAEPVLAALAREGLELVAILNTHHHWDHVGANEALRGRFGDLPVYGHASDLAQGRVPGQTVGVEEGTPFDAAGLTFRPLYVPGHTLGAVAYVVNDAVFTGDTMFVAGCGRLFEGTPAMMYASLCQKLGRLPDETKLYCGHEYTVSNLRFAVFAEPENEDVKRALVAAQDKRSRGEPTVPSTMAEEHRTNPFLRVDEPSLRAKFGGTKGAETLGKVRAAKDGFR
ncbi:hydroxyacylglutathione hydrolase [Polyangium fumosum]|uniref:Hydroxyacylglutathione hydrolase n=1 Tax=Polyangium fumosum TaxID=889272 RepID=A0A4U1JA76_9BACT|nr:hydroxyacylglutathione hydrolase [Polyangium fumosum]TKD05154.1 hydroxyacylglutathione hydrolase [Polyangium fumosum]